MSRPITSQHVVNLTWRTLRSTTEESIGCIQEESETPPTEPNLKSIQGAISVMQDTIAKLVKENNKLSGDVADLRHIIAKNNGEEGFH